jgi:hypothetical protein
MKNGIDVETNVPHLITQRRSIQDAPDFKLGYIGAGPKELAANVLWYSNVSDEGDCFRFAGEFQSDVLDKQIDEQGYLSATCIEAWLEDKKIAYNKFKN